MKLSEVAASGLDVATGVLFDGVDLFPRPTISRLTIVAVAEDGELDQDLIDTLIAYKSLRVDVGIEVPFNLAIDPAVLLRISGPLGLDVRLLPPLDAVDSDAYIEMIRLYTSMLPRLPTMAQAVEPISDALGILVRRRLEQRDDILFEEAPAGFDPERIISAVRSGFESALGGPEAFDEYIDLYIAGIMEDSRRRLAEHVRGNAVPQPKA